MDLAEENKKHIDSLSYEGLLARWRNAPVGDPWFQGETGDFMPLHQCPLCRIEIVDEDGEKSYEYGIRALCGNRHSDHHQDGWKSCRKNRIEEAE